MLSNYNHHRNRREGSQLDPRKPSPIGWFVLLAILLHIAAWVGWQWWHLNQPQEASIEPLQPISLSFRPSEAKRQIVETRQPEQKPQQPTDLLAQRDTRTDREMIAKNSGPIDQPPQAQESSETEQSRKGPGTRKPKLVPTVQELVAGSRAQQSNYLERDQGPVTLLNAHSSPFAGYLIETGHRTVRFLNLNSSLMSWYLADVQSLRFPAQLQMTLDRNGSVIESRLQKSSGSRKIDNWFSDAVVSGFTGQPPPSEMLGAQEKVVIIAQLHPDHIAVGIP